MVVMVFEKLKKILSQQLDIDEDSISMESDIAEDLGADSLDVVDLVMTVEEEFDITFEDEQIETFKTVEDIVRHIEQY